jgi:hypothetical protein
LNVANAGADESFQSLNTRSPLFGLGSARQVPRAAQLGLRLSF